MWQGLYVPLFLDLLPPLVHLPPPLSEPDQVTDVPPLAGLQGLRGVVVARGAGVEGSQGLEVVEEAGIYCGAM